jgi:Fe-S-cluster-containing dehydrogenase component
VSKYNITQDKSRCIACLTCEIYCKKNKDIAEGNKARPCQIVILDKRKGSNIPREAYIYMACFHCDQPSCVASCPTGAMTKREKDGIVYVDYTKCVGCKACMVACPWGAVQWNPELFKAQKCDLCMDRIDQGLKPVCVTVCTSGCLHFTDSDSVDNENDETERQ